MPDLDVSKLLSVREALDILDHADARPRIVRVPLAEAAGLRLAQTVVTDRAYPPFTKSLMDGYAIRAADVAGRSGPVDLRVVGKVAAGMWPQTPLEAGQAISIMTGAPLPPGADAVVPVEDVERREDAIRILRPTVSAGFIAKQGSDCAASLAVLKPGTPIGPTQIAVMATVGVSEVDAFDRPHVAVLSTGDELVPVTADPGPGQIRDANGPMLIALLQRMGCRVENLGISPDNPDELRERIEAGLKHDALFVTGGMSMGEHDYVPRLLQEIGVELKITKLRIKPGKPFVFGQRARESGPGFVFGLPGNPVSAFVCTMRLASRLLDRMSGGESRESWQTGRLEVGMIANGPREFYQPVIRTVSTARNSTQMSIGSIRPLTWKGSADLFTLAAANALLIRGENEPALPMGTVVRVLEI